MGNGSEKRRRERKRKELSKDAANCRKKTIGHNSRFRQKANQKPVK
jgi:hypothetical protein